ncbi:MAG: putative secondary metabolism biosynthetic enzyme [Sarcosagium campestre]|nr:MAG: putative secondary metabolism biosynthetic enzyme [Sarcosagium campestre]
MAKSDEGIEALQTCSLVTFHGSACPDEVGDRLVAQNVNLVGHMGSTETGALMTSFRPKGDDAWNYYRFLPSVKPFIYMKPIDADNFECVILEGLNSVALTNSDDPPNSYHTKDIFMPHPRIEGAWKYVSRLDDRITLVNGEKILPLPIEGLIRENPLVKEAIVFGVGRSVPGLLVFRNRDADAMTDEEFTSSLWPTIQRANSKAESFSQISKEMIIAFASEVEYPRTDKGSIMRAKAYEKFANEIRDSYIERSSEGKLKLAPQECRGFLQQTIQERFGLDIGVDDDLYTAGVDSLRATQLSRLITSRLYLGDNANKIGPNFVYECGTILKLAEYLTDLGKNFTDFKSSSFGSVEELIQKYSQFPKHVPAWRSSDQNHVVVLTGATGSMGTYVLARLVEKETVNKVICLVRAEDREAALARVLASVKTRRLILPEKALDKITAFGSDLSKEDLGLGRPILDQLKNEVSVIIHCAWAVNFNLGIHSFEDQHLRGTFNLIGLSLCARAPRPARMIFCSSVSVAAKTSPHTTVPEALIENFSVVSETGYAQSKYVAEHMLANAVETGGARGQVLRIGQVVGDTIHGVWNDSEAIPLMIRSALTLKALPALQEEMSWLPVDQLADIILDLASISAPPFSEQTADGSMVYNVVNPARFSWTQDLLPALRNAGMEFETTAPKEWISRLQASDPDVGVNPAYKLLAFFTERYDYGSEDEGRGNPIFDTKRAQAASNTMRNLPHSLKDKLIKKFVDSWMSKWTRPRAA